MCPLVFQRFINTEVCSVLPVHLDGDVCISILHEPGEDKYGYEKPEERWLPIHTVETIVLSVIAMLSDPNDQSPANLDAAVCVFVCVCVFMFWLVCILLTVFRRRLNGANIATNSRSVCSNVSEKVKTLGDGSDRGL